LAFSRCFLAFSSVRFLSERVAPPVPASEPCCPDFPARSSRRREAVEIPIVIDAAVGAETFSSIAMSGQAGACGHLRTTVCELQHVERENKTWPLIRGVCRRERINPRGSVGKAKMIHLSHHMATPATRANMDRSPIKISATMHRMVNVAHVRFAEYNCNTFQLMVEYGNGDVKHYGNVDPSVISSMHDALAVGTSGASGSPEASTASGALQASQPSTTAPHRDERDERDWVGPAWSSRRWP
jgi:hypothetical protein